MSATVGRSGPHIGIDAEELAGHSFPYQHDISLVRDIDLQAATPGADLNWLEDVTMLEEDGVPAVFDRYSNSFLKIYFAIPEGQADDVARKVLIAHLQSGNSYGIRLKAQHAKFPQPTLGPWVEGSATAGQDWQQSVLEGWEPPDGHSARQPEMTGSRIVVEGAPTNAGERSEVTQTVVRRKSRNA